MRRLGQTAMRLQQRMVAAALLAAFFIAFTVPLLAASSQPACEMTCCRDKGASCDRRAHSSHDSAWAAAAGCPTGCSTSVSAGVSHALVGIQTTLASGGPPASLQIARLPEPPVARAAYRAYLYQRPPPFSLAF